jgi:hypothetical protein
MQTPKIEVPIENIAVNMDICKAIIEQGKRKGETCIKKAVIDGYCGKHAPRHIILEKAKINNKQLCNEGKRGCLNEVKLDCKKCKDCLSKQTLIDNEKYDKIIADVEQCRICCIKPFIPARNTKGNALTLCISCHAKTSITEANRPERNRNYKTERKRNISSTFDQFKVDAFKRGLTVHISLEQYENIVNKACSYCGKYEENEIRGIDRINSAKAYYPENCVACCGICNTMKMAQSLEDFTAQILKIAAYICQNPISVPSMEHIPICDRKKNKTSSECDYNDISNIIKLYDEKKLDELIEWSIVKKKSARYVSRLQDFASYHLSTTDFITSYKHARELELREMAVVKKGKKRMQIDEKIALFNQDRSIEFFQWHYETFGKTRGLVEKIDGLKSVWKTYSEKEKKSAIDTLDNWINARRMADKVEILEIIEL